MNRASLVAASAATTLVLAAPLAYAQPADPVLTVTPSQACGRVTLDATTAAGTYEIAVFSGPNSGDAAAEPLGQFRVGPDAAVTRTFTLDEDAHGGSGFVSWATISGPEQDNYVQGAVAVDTDCQPVEDPPPAEQTPPADAPSATDEGTPTDPAATGDGPVDCVDFTSQPAAQAALIEDPADPGNLDGDDDGIACEDPLDGLTGGGQVSQVPVGAVDTGSW